MGFKLKMPKIKIDNKTLGNVVRNVTRTSVPLTNIPGIGKYTDMLDRSIVTTLGGKDVTKPGQQPVPEFTGNPEIDKMLVYRQQRELDLQRGRERGDQIFTEGTLGRLDPAVMEARKQAATRGYTDQEMSAMRDQNMMLNQQMRGDARAQRIAMAAEGVRGGRAMALQNKALSEQGAQRAQLERDLFLKGVDARRQGMTDYEAAQKYNIDQKNKELQGRLTTELGYGALGAADRGAAVQSMVGAQQAQAAARAGGGGGKK